MNVRQICASLGMLTLAGAGCSSGESAAVGPSADGKAAAAGESADSASDDESSVGPGAGNSPGEVEHSSRASSAEVSDGKPSTGAGSADTGGTSAAPRLDTDAGGSRTAVAASGDGGGLSVSLGADSPVSELDDEPSPAAATRDEVLGMEATPAGSVECSGLTRVELLSGCWGPEDCGAALCVRGTPPPCGGNAPASPPACWQGGPCAEGYECVEGSGCRPVECTEDADCSEIQVCDPGLGTDAFGCRPADCSLGEVNCDEPREICNVDTGRCDHRRCDDPDALPCEAGEACGELTGYCAPPGSVCTPIGCDLLHCSDPGALPCAEGSVCDPEQSAFHGCRGVPCDEPGGLVCPDGSACEEGGCRVLNCSEAGALACDQVCDPLAPGRGCFECVADSDCACGICRANTCVDAPAPGQCLQPCP